MKLLLENWKKYLGEEEYRPIGQEMMFPAKYLFSHMGEYRTETFWKEFRELPEEEQVEWAKKVKLDEPVEVTVFADGQFGHGDGHHRAMAGKILKKEIPIIITRNKIKQKSEEMWNAWLERVMDGNHPKKLNPEGYVIRTMDQIQ